MERFEIALNQLKLLEQVEIQKFQSSRSSFIEKNEKSRIPTETRQSYQPSMCKIYSWFTFLAKETSNDYENDQQRKFLAIRNLKKFQTTKEIRKSDDEDDFLEDPQDEGVLDMMFNEFVQKDG